MKDKGIRGKGVGEKDLCCVEKSRLDAEKIAVRDQIVLEVHRILGLSLADPGEFHLRMPVDGKLWIDGRENRGIKL